MRTLEHGQKGYNRVLMGLENVQLIKKIVLHLLTRLTLIFYIFLTYIQCTRHSHLSLMPIFYLRYSAEILLYSLLFSEPYLLRYSTWGDYEG